MKQVPDFSTDETQKRFEKFVRAALKTPPMPLKSIGRKRLLRLKNRRKKRPAP
jgi:hypothetical protein